MQNSPAFGTFATTHQTGHRGINCGHFLTLEDRKGKVFPLQPDKFSFPLPPSSSARGCSANSRAALTQTPGSCSESSNSPKQQPLPGTISCPGQLTGAPGAAVPSLAPQGDKGMLGDVPLQHTFCWAALPLSRHHETAPQSTFFVARRPIQSRSKHRSPSPYKIQPFRTYFCLLLSIKYDFFSLWDSN